jgi:alanine racemase
MDSTAPAILTIDLKALADNYRRIAGMSRATVSGVVKADGYGCGMGAVAKTLYNAGCRHFFVATPDEAITLREQDSTSQIFVLGGLYRGAEEFYAGRGIIPVLNSKEQVQQWGDIARRLGTKLPAALQFDTGMNRLGLSLRDSIDTDCLDLRLILTHFACSDEAGHPMNDRQAADFATIAAAYPLIPKSLSNSSGVFRNSAWHYDLLRPGYALYGGNPTPEKINPMKPVVTLKARILQIRTVEAGETAGYNATHIFHRPARLATIAAGYADGIPRAGSNRAKLYAGRHACPVVGRVSMDAIIADITDCPERVEEGDWLDILGPQQGVDELARECGTIGYEILTALGARYTRQYVS